MTYHYYITLKIIVKIYNINNLWYIINIVPNYITQKDINVIYNDAVDFYNDPNYKIDPFKVNAVVSKRPIDGNLFKVIINTDKFPNADWVECWGGCGQYYDSFNAYATEDALEGHRMPLISNGSNKKEALLNLDKQNYPSYFRYPARFSCSIYIYDKKGKRIYVSSEMWFAIINEIGTEMISKDISIEINGQTISSGINPIQDNGSTFVPVRFVSENLGAKVDFDAKTKGITLVKNDHVVKLNTADSKLIKGTTFVPIRMIAEAFNCQIHWDKDNLKVIIIEN